MIKSSATDRAEEAPLLKENHTYYFNDSKKRIDYVLVYDPRTQDSRRKHFLKMLRQEKKLELKIENAKYNPALAFVMVHAPESVLLAGAVTFAVPIKCHQTLVLGGTLPQLRCMGTDLLDPPPDSPLLTRAKEALFREPLKNFTIAERISIVYNILRFTSCRASDGDQYAGLSQLLYADVFIAAYPLHDGDWTWPQDPAAPLNDRQLLKRYWASIDMVNKQQPVDLIEKYYGMEVAMYFVWMGFFNQMLMAASVFGLLAIAYSLLSYQLIDYAPVEEVCASNKTICPRCEHCNYTLLSDYCSHFKLAYMHDNVGSVVFAVFMSLWGTVCMGRWKRSVAYLKVRWNTMNTDLLEEHITRPEYMTRAKVWRKGKYTREWEQVMPAAFRISRHALSLTVVSCMIMLVLVISFGVIIVEMELARLAFSGQWLSFLSSLATLLIMMVMRRGYYSVALWLTRMEVPRTRLEYDRSYMFKIIVFSFVNNYGKLMYIAFLKGALFTFPGDKEWILAQDVCDPAGCVTDVFMLLMVIMLLRPLYFQICQLCIPVCRVWHKQMISATILPTWEQEFALEACHNYDIFAEVDKTVRQYGFTLLLVPAFPLAPLCALVYNLIEVRLDAMRMLLFTRRPNPQRISGMSVWFDTMQGITYTAVLTHALYISFTSDFVPKMVYQYDAGWGLEGYVDFTLSEFRNASSLWPNLDIASCYYVGFRNPPDHAQPYQRSFTYYYILSMRLSLAMIIAVIIFVVNGLLAYAIPEIPRSVKSRLVYEAKKARGLIK